MCTGALCKEAAFIIYHYRMQDVSGGMSVAAGAIKFIRLIRFSGENQRRRADLRGLR
jgi:hypothetical protein